MKGGRVEVLERQMFSILSQSTFWLSDRPGEGEAASRLSLCSDLPDPWSSRNLL